MDIEKATKIIKYKIKKYKEELEIELEDKIGYDSYKWRFEVRKMPEQN